MTDRVGQRLGNYRLTRLLGKGGFAEVYLGEHLRLGTHAAVKVLYTRLASPEEVISFEKEAQTIAHLKHPHIVRVFDFDVQDDTPFLVMDYAVGGTLRQRHPKGSVLPLPTVISYVKQVAEALQYAHDHKLIHRDVKPENMLLGERGELLLSDFGIALIAQSSRYQGTQDMAGTIAYMAPEQIQGKPRSASDQYALGVVVYEWLSGDRPFHGSFTEIAVQHTITPPPPLRVKVPTILPDVEQVVMTTLAKDPKGRFGSLQAFVNALEQASQTDVATFVKPPALVVLPPRTTIPSGFPLTLPLTSPSSPKHPEEDAAPIGTVIYTYRGHSKSVNAVAWSPDVNRIASGGADKTVQVWDAAGGGHVFTYRGHSDIVDAVAWSPDVNRIASGGDDKTVQVWDAAGGGHVFTYRGHSDIVDAVAWSPDGKRIASGSQDNTVQVWDAADGGHVFIYRGHSNAVYQWHGRPMGSASPRGVLIKQCKCGMRPMAATRSRIMGILILCMRWRGHPMGSASPRGAGIGRCRCGTLPLEVMCSPIVGILILCMRWSGRLMGSAALPALGIRQCRCGMRLMEAISSPIMGILILCMQ